MSAWAGVAIAGAAAGYALVSRRLASTVLTAPMVFVGVGVAIGPVGLDLISLQRNAGPVLTLLQLTLALVLFTDATALRTARLRRQEFLPRRLLVIGLPLTICLGWLLAWPLLPGLNIWELALVAIVLAPTDGTLCRPALNNQRVPALVRDGLNVESGLNDGLCLPFFVLALVAAVPAAEGGHGPLDVFVRALVISSVLGAAAGWFGGWLLVRAGAAGWVDPLWQQLHAVAVALFGYGLATVVSGSGFIAAWVAGIAFVTAVRPRVHVGDRLAEKERTAAFAENLATLLTAISFLIFGAVLLGPALQRLNWRVAVYAALSLTVIRLLPVAVALAGRRLKAPTIAYVGWFGPRGLPSIVLGLLVVKTAGSAVGHVGDVVAVTVGLSVIAHGATAVALSDRYADWYGRRGSQAASADPGGR